MDELIVTLVDVLSQSGFEHYVVPFLALCVFLSHTVHYLPVSLTQKIPNWLMYSINVLASKHGASKSAQTDMNGNPK